MLLIQSKTAHSAEGDTHAPQSIPPSESDPARIFVNTALKLGLARDRELASLVAAKGEVKLSESEMKCYDVFLTTLRYSSTFALISVRFLIDPLIELGKTLTTKEQARVVIAAALGAEEALITSRPGVAEGHALTYAKVKLLIPEIEKSLAGVDEKDKLLNLMKVIAARLGKCEAKEAECVSSAKTHIAATGIAVGKTHGRVLAPAAAAAGPDPVAKSKESSAGAHLKAGAGPVVQRTHTSR